MVGLRFLVPSIGVRVPDPQQIRYTYTMNKSGGFIGIGIIILSVVLLGAAAGGYYFQKNQKEGIQLTERQNDTAIVQSDNSIEVTATQEKVSTDKSNVVSVASNTSVSLTSEQKKSIAEQVAEFKSFALATGTAWTTETEAEYTKAATEVVIKGSEAGIKSLMTYGVTSTAEIYFSQHNSYGTSAVANVCTDTGMTAILNMANAHTTIKPSCKISSSLPSKTFTVIVPSLLQKNYYFCTDTTVSTTPILLSDGYKAGEKCK